MAEVFQIAKVISIMKRIQKVLRFWISLAVGKLGFGQILINHKP